MSKELGGIVKAWEATKRKSHAIAKKRFPTMSVVNVDEEDEVDGAIEVIQTEKFFSSGDIYIGQWAENYPHGQGKYLWADGCMYVGDWHKGKTMGKGKFSWPSGATYEGIFNNGYMDGEGTYMGVSTETYKGAWVMNNKQGKGAATYDNGDVYEGEWRKGMQDGQGRYQWSNGNQYIGNWKNGKIKGNGTLIWANGNRYDGCWEDGFPKGNGTFRWADGSFYVGVWNKDPKDQTGTYYPLTSQLGNFDWDPQEVYLVDLNDCVLCTGEKIVIYPSQKMVFDWSGVEGESVHKSHHLRKGSKGSDNNRPKRLSLDGRLSNGGIHSWGSDSEVLKAYSGLGSGREIDDDDSESRGTPNQIHQTKRQGETIYKGHKNYELMLNLQLGIRYNFKLIISFFYNVYILMFTSLVFM